MKNLFIVKGKETTGMRDIHWNATNTGTGRQAERDQEILLHKGQRKSFIGSSSKVVLI